MPAVVNTIHGCYFHHHMRPRARRFSIFDGGLTIIRRALRGENIFHAHPTHPYQRLVIRGWSHRAVSGLNSAYAPVSGARGFAIGAGQSPLPALVPLSLGILLIWWVTQVEPRTAPVTT